LLSKLLGPFQVKEYLHWVASGLDLGEDLSEDISFLRTLRRSFLPLPFLDSEPVLETALFPTERELDLPALEGKKIGIVATGGSGGTIATLGIMRACEEAGLDVVAISACSGSALFLAPIAAGLSAQETVDFVLGWRLSDYMVPEWRQLLKIPLALGRGFTGLLNGEVIEQLYHERVGGVMVKDLHPAFYANLWDLDHNRLCYMGTRTKPDLRLARLVRVAMSLPLYVQPLEMDGILYGDGGVINIFPVDPLVQHHPEIDLFIGVNTFYPLNFDGEDLSGWEDQTASILRVSPQPRHGQHLEVARLQLRLIQDRCLLLHPISYEEVKGVRFYEQFLDRSRWPEFIVRSYYHARRNLVLWDRSL
jgi:NTE family protein